jgi:hypothetical protein
VPLLRSLFFSSTERCYKHLAPAELKLARIFVAKRY